ncbi:ribonuclease T2 [Sphingomonas sp.]|uniref:ribonuclease T2 n=1 Tax=Sphingomonas sp. TaxID=28214 RepID=UPI0025D87263|nr:ribonuclease T2 [Sphingomonas sp.]
MTRLALAALALLGQPALAQAQAYRCAVPATVETPRAEGPTDREPARLLPIGGYTLALSWAAEYCHGNGGERSAQFQCGTGNRFGFVLHGLWPDGEGAVWPQYCRPAALLPGATIRRNLCATPSAQLLQHEWAKHGTCMSDTPDAYFARSTGLFARLRFPDMDALSRVRGLTAGQVAQALATANPGLSPAMMRIVANRRGWLEEVWLCLDRRFRYATCPAHQAGTPPDARVKIWRGDR